MLKKLLIASAFGVAALNAARPESQGSPVLAPVTGPVTLPIDATTSGENSNAAAIGRINDNGTAPIHLCCGKLFKTEQSLKQHSEAKHSEANHSNLCRSCGKQFKTEQSLQQHHEAKHSNPVSSCQSCGKQFKTEQSLQQHREAKHSKNQSRVFVPGPPFGLPGKWITREEWITRDDLKGAKRKRFGFFLCECGKRWFSAHSQVRYKQGCQNCNRYWLPYYLWLNTGRGSGSSGRRQSKAGHDSGRCEACQNDDCIQRGEQ